MRSRYLCGAFVVLALCVLVSCSSDAVEGTTENSVEDSAREDTTEDSPPDAPPASPETTSGESGEATSDEEVPESTQASIQAQEEPKETPAEYDEEGIEVAADSLIVTYEDEADKEAPKSSAEVEKVEVFDTINAESVEVQEGEAQEKKAELEAQEGVASVERDPIMHLDWSPNDKHFVDDGDRDQDNLPAIDAPRAWDLARGSGVRVAVIDSGCYRQHDDLDADNKVSGQVDILNNDSVADDTTGHGTWVSSVIAAETNNRLTIASVAPAARLLCVKVTGKDSGLKTSDVMAGVQWAYDRGAKVMNMSFGGLGYSSSFANLLSSVTQNAVVVASIGNTGGNAGTRYPVSYSGVTGVSGLTENGAGRWSGSSYGSAVDISAPATGIWADSNRCPTCSGTVQGTSFAAPEVAGAAALRYSRYPSSTGAQVRGALQNSADDLGSPGRDDVYGYGRLDAHGTVYLSNG